MAWFEHRHYWRPKTDLSTIKKQDGSGNAGALFIEDCSCGAIRQVEFQPGRAPIIYVTERPEQSR